MQGLTLSETCSSPHLEPCWAPVDELDTLLHLDAGDGSVHILGNNIASVERADRHVLSWMGPFELFVTAK